jgi:CheY-like chemotaxis protein
MEPAQEGATYRNRARSDGVRILLAEDDVALRRLFAAPSRNGNGVSMVVEAEDHASAAARALYTYPHVAVFDNHMPCLSGIDAALHLRKQQLAFRLNSAVRG